MQEPIRGFINKYYPEGSVTQYFGENPQLYRRILCKKDGDKTICLQGHNGVDIVAPWGTPIFAVKEGIVATVTNTTTGFGKSIKTVNFDDGEEWTYAHLSRIDVVENQLIEAGEQIGLMGNTGFVISGDTPYWDNNPYAGTHLHLGLRNIEDSDKYPRRTYGNGMRAHVKDWRNGFFGAVDWIPQWKGKERTLLQLKIIQVANEIISLYRRLIEIKSRK